MTYSSLMVYVDLLASDDAAVWVAAELAQGFGAKLIGVTAGEESQSPYFAAGPYAESILAQDRARLRERMDEAEARFRQVLAGALSDTEWRSALDFPTNWVAREARAADLVVATCTGDELLTDPVIRLDPSALVMQAGRPVLLVPPGTTGLAPASVVVAWKDAREARRAVRDALPLLQRAGKVSVFEIVESDDEIRNAKARVADVAAWLAHHGIAASTQVPMPTGEVFAQIDQVAAEAKADLIVAGAYGHTRLGEWAFGGVTRHLLTRCVRCTLLAH